MKANVFIREDDIFKEVEITDSKKPEIPNEFIEKWQEIITLISKIIDVPAALIMEITEAEKRVFLKSDNKNNPYKKGAGDSLGHGLYCETVIGENSELHVDNALLSDTWNDNPDIELNMISYYGLPIKWPDNEFFGTICVLDNSTNNFKDIYKELLDKFRKAFEDDLRLLVYEKQLKNYFYQSKLDSIIKLTKKNKFIQNISYTNDEHEEKNQNKKSEENKVKLSDLSPFITKLDKIIYHDKLTGLYNRRYFINQMNKIKKNAEYPVSIVVGDLDNLKSINDNYGHNIGDEYIKRAAKILKNNFRNYDILARIGGDEFAVILPETDKNEVKLICSRIKEKFINANYEINLKYPLRISLGISTIRNSNQKIESAFINADKNMYKDKGVDIKSS